MSLVLPRVMSRIKFQAGWGAATILPSVPFSNWYDVDGFREEVKAIYAHFDEIYGGGDGGGGGGGGDRLTGATFELVEQATQAAGHAEGEGGGGGGGGQAHRVSLSLLGAHASPSELISRLRTLINNTHYENHGDGGQAQADTDDADSYTNNSLTISMGCPLNAIVPDSDAMARRIHDTLAALRPSQRFSRIAESIKREINGTERGPGSASGSGFGPTSGSRSGPGWHAVHMRVEDDMLTDTKLVNNQNQQSSSSLTASTGSDSYEDSMRHRLVARTAALLSEYGVSAGDVVYLATGASDRAKALLYPELVQRMGLTLVTKVG